MARILGKFGWDFKNSQQDNVVAKQCLVFQKNQQNTNTKK